MDTDNYKLTAAPTSTSEDVPDALASANQFDPARLRLSPDFGASLGVKKALLTVPVRKPDRQWFVRVHPDEDYRIPVAILELKDNREMYIVDLSLAPTPVIGEASSERS